MVNTKRLYVLYSVLKHLDCQTALHTVIAAITPVSVPKPALQLGFHSGIGFHPWRI